MTAAATDIKPGFSNPVAGAQSAFRAALNAMSRPGTRHQATGIEAPPAGLYTATAALCLTLLDQDTTLWIAPELSGDETKAFVRFHCGCPIVTDRSHADFALVTAKTVLLTWGDTVSDVYSFVILQTAGSGFALPMLIMLIVANLIMALQAKLMLKQGIIPTLAALLGLK